LKTAALWAPVVVLMAAIFSASSLSDPGLPPGGLSDKGAHIVAYAALGAALIRALASGQARSMTVRRVLIAAVLATAYGMTDELHQGIVPGRTPELLDLVADAAGGLAGAILFAGIAKALARLQVFRSGPGRSIP
jgi:VanZ family protein